MARNTPEQAERRRARGQGTRPAPGGGRGGGGPAPGEGASQAPRREAGRGVPDPRDPGPRGREAGWDGRAPGGRGGGGAETGGVGGGRTGGVPPGAPRLTDRRPGGCRPSPASPS